MNTKRFTFSITAGIAVVILLIVGATTILPNTGYAQTATGSQNQTTEEVVTKQEEQTTEVFIVQNTSMSVPASVTIMVSLYTQ